MDIKIPAFNETNYSRNTINETSEVTNICNATSDLYISYCKYLEDEKFIKKENSDSNFKSYSSFEKDGYGIFLNYYKSLNEINIIVEKSCNYFSFTDNPCEKKVAPQITQVALADFGMSYAIRLSDGRFIIIDGGRELRCDAENLYKTLKTGSPYDKPVIAAWIMTHAHCDHYRCFNEFTKHYSDNVIIEKFLYNFPALDSLTGNQFQTMRPEIKDEFNFENSSDKDLTNLMRRNMESYNGKIIMPHTGQTYIFGDTKIEFLSTIDDVFHIGNYENSFSLVFKMEIAGQTVLWTGDAAFSDARLLEKYGNYIKADIMQVPHHGFFSGTPEGQIKCYDVIKPSVCLLPVSEYNAYTAIDIYKNSTRYLMTKVGIDEMITGSENRTITLPYTPLKYKKEELDKKVKEGLSKSGATSWIFTGLNTSNEDDFVFTLLNTTATNINVEIELFFEDNLSKITKILAVIPTTSLRTINIIDENDVERNCEYFNWHSINVNPILENKPFAVRFLSDEPIVVSHKNYKEAYRN